MLEEPITEPKLKAVKVGHMDADNGLADKKVGAGSEPPQIMVTKATNIKNPWVCLKCGAIMGSIFHEKIRQGLSITHLILFRGAVLITETMPANFVFGKVDAGEFGCGRCGEVRIWHPTPEALRYLLDNGNHHARKKNRNV